MASYLQVPSAPFGLSSAALLQHKTQQQQQQQRKQAGAQRTHAPRDLLAFVQPATHTHTPEEQQPFSRTHTAPPCVPSYRLDTSVSCKATAPEVGNAIASGLSSTFPRHHDVCSIKCNADAYTLSARAFIGYALVEASIVLYGDGACTVVECVRVSGERLAFLNFWQDIKACLCARGLLEQEKRTAEFSLDMCALEEEMWEELETDVPSDVSSETSGDETPRRVSLIEDEKPHPFFELAVSCDVRELEEAAQLAARMVGHTHTREVLASPQGVSALATVLDRACALSQGVVWREMEGGVETERRVVFSVLGVVYPVVCAMQQIAAETPRTCVDAHIPSRLVSTLRHLLAPPAVSPAACQFNSTNGNETAMRAALRCLLDLCVSSHVSSIAAGGLRAQLGGLGDAVSGCGDAQTQQMFERVVGELARK